MDNKWPGGNAGLFVARLSDETRGKSRTTRLRQREHAVISKQLSGFENPGFT